MQDSAEIELRLAAMRQQIAFAEACADARELDTLIARTSALIFEWVSADVVALVAPPGLSTKGPAITVASRHPLTALSELVLREESAEVLRGYHLDPPPPGTFEFVKAAELTPLHSTVSTDRVYPIWSRPLIHEGEIGAVLVLFGFTDWLLAERLLSTLESVLPSMTHAVFQAACFARLRARVSEDGLTGVLNRRGFEDSMHRECARARRADRDLALLLIDVDRFKEVNDQFGHPAGDRVLTGLCDAMGAILRRSDAVCRIGGDEFAVILPEVDIDTAWLVAERLVTACRGVRVQDLPVSVSVGVAALDPSHPEPAEDVFLRADEALYDAKRGGRGRISRAG